MVAGEIFLIRSLKVKGNEELTFYSRDGTVFPAGIRSGTRIGYYDSNKNRETCAMLFVVKTEKSFIPLSHQAASDEELVLF